MPGIGMGEEGQDALLKRFLTELDPAAAQACLERLLNEHVAPIVSSITRYKLRSAFATDSVEKQDEEDIRSEVVLQLISRLNELRSTPTLPGIEDLRGYVATATYNACHKSIRTRHPARWRLKNRLRYLMNHSSEFALWPDEHGEYLCGLSSWKNASKDRIASEPRRDLNFEEFQNSLPSNENPARMKLADLVHAFLKWRGQPIEIDEFVTMVAELQGIRELRQAFYTDEEEAEGNSVCDLLPDSRVDVLTQMEQRAHLERLWTEICQLPQRQRFALLLNLRDARSQDALVLFTMTGIASLHRIAEVIEWPAEEFAAIWNKLPLEDTVIAANLGVTRQQVINLRKSARERLARRMVAGQTRASGHSE